MMNLEFSQASYIGGIKNLQHNATMKNGSLVNRGARIKDDVFAVSVPSTATLDTAEVYVIFNDETSYEVGKSISDYIVPANTPARAYPLQEGMNWTIDNTDFSGTAVVGQFLVPANGTIVGAISATATANTLQIVVTDINLTIGFDRRPATRFEVKRVK